jgi:hypothetical protein
MPRARQQRLPRPLPLLAGNWQGMDDTPEPVAADPQFVAMARNCYLPPLSAGDLLALLHCGAYGLSYSPTMFLSHAAPAEVLASELDRQRLRVLSPPGEPGVVDLAVTNGNGNWRGPRAFLYVAADDGPFALDGIAPDRLPSTGGQSFVVGGNGFDAATRVLLDGEPIACLLERAQLLRCTPPARAPGTVDVTVERGEEQRTLADALTFYEAIEILDLANEITELSEDQQRLLDRKRRIETERAYLRRPARIGEQAAERLGMVPAPPERIQPIELLPAAPELEADPEPAAPTGN